MASRTFLADLERFVDRIRIAGETNSLAQTLMKHTAPGVPDLYQGAELWDYSLVDPDNRRPVDYSRRRSLLAELKGIGVADVVARRADGLPKLWTIYHALQLRREHPEWFGAEAGYTPIEANGDKRDHMIAYLRGDRVLTVTQRFPLTLGASEAWGNTSITVPAGAWKNRLSGEQLQGGEVLVRNLFESFPVALLVRETEVHA